MYVYVCTCVYTYIFNYVYIYIYKQCRSGIPNAELPVRREFVVKCTIRA